MAGKAMARMSATRRSPATLHATRARIPSSDEGAAVSARDAPQRVQKRPAASNGAPHEGQNLHCPEGPVEPLEGWDEAGSGTGAGLPGATR